jgi:hypothetical protein
MRVLSLCLMLISSTVFADAQVDPDKAQHDQLVMLALEYDFYNQRCRGMSMQKHFNQVKRLFVTKYSQTPNNYIEAFMVSSGNDFRAFKKAQESKFLQSLAQQGGCKGFKSSGRLQQLQKAFNLRFQSVESSSWFPIINRLEIAQ